MRVSRKDPNFEDFLREVSREAVWVFRSFSNPVDHDVYADLLDKPDDFTEYREDESLLFCYEANVLNIVDDEARDITKYTFIVNISQKRVYGLLEAGDISRWDGNAHILLEKDFYHPALIRDMPDDVEVIECHGDKCRLNISDGNVWCTSCYSIDIGSVSHHVLLRRVEVAEIPVEAIVSIEKEIIQVESTKEGLAAVANHVDDLRTALEDIEKNIVGIDVSIARLQKKREELLESKRVAEGRFSKDVLKNVNHKLAARLQILKEEERERLIREEDGKLKKEMEMIQRKRDALFRK